MHICSKKKKEKGISNTAAVYQIWSYLTHTALMKQTRCVYN